MNSIKTTIRRTYEAAALVALLNLIVLMGGVTFVLASGKLNAEKVQLIASVMRGDDLIIKPEEPAPDESSTEEAEKEDNAKELNLPNDLEIVQREAQRIREELRQRTAINNSIMLRLTNERERFRLEQEAAAKRVAAKQRERNTKGFRKQIDLLENIAPKVAVKHLLAMGDADDAAEILLMMDTRKAKRIIEAAKDDNDSRKMMAIMRKVRSVSPEQSDELESRSSR